MATLDNTQGANPRKHFALVSRNGAGAPRPERESKAERRARLCPSRHLTPDQHIRLLACIEREGGIATLDEIARALPAVTQPISAVFDLCDLGILSADFEAAFDGSMRVCRVGL